MSDIIWNADLHVHTNKSHCSKSYVVPETYIPYCAQEDIKVLGISNHLYYGRNDKGEIVPTRENTAWNLEARDDINAISDTMGVRVLLGCEVETVYGLEPSLPREDASKYDYILLAASHVANIPGLYEGVDYSTKEKLSDLTVERFRYACELDFGVPAGICHPLYPIGSPWEQEIVDGFSDSLLEDLFSLARRKNKSIEIHACLFRPGTARDETGLSPSYIRLLSAAKACGCRFHFGADAHVPDAFVGRHALLRLAAERAGITKDDMWDLI